MGYLKQKAAAMMMAVMMTAVIATMATAMMVSSHLLITQATMVRHALEIKRYLNDLEVLAGRELLLKWKSTKGQLYHVGFFINGGSVGHVQVTGKIYDVSGLFNINLLKHSNMIPYFTTLIHEVSPTTSLVKAKELSKNIYLFISRPDQGLPYSNFVPPYQPAGQPFVSRQSLRLVSGFSASLVNKLLPYIVVLPEKAKVNINSASIMVLRALLTPKKASIDNAQSLMSCKQDVTYFSSDKALAACTDPLKNKGISLNTQAITFTSRYFLLYGSIQQGSRSYHPMALLTLVSDKPSQPAGDAGANNKTIKKWPKLKIVWQSW